MEYVVRTTNKLVMLEDSFVRQIIYTVLSAGSKNPINLGTLAPTSDGKTYPIITTLNQFPEENIWYIGSMSTKVLVRQRSIEIDKDGNPIKPQIKELKKAIEKAKEDDDEDLEEQLTDELEELYENIRHLIDLRNKTVVFLESPDIEVWNLLKPILSHDKEEIAFPVVEKTEVGFKTKWVIVKGWPACIFCSAKDETDDPIWPEIKSRFLIISPNSIPEKFLKSNKLLADRKGLPSIVQQQTIISNEELYKARKCVLYLIRKIEKLSKSGEDRVWIPYEKYLSAAYPAEKGTDTRALDRVLSFLNIIPLVKSDNRFTLEIGHPSSPAERNIIASLEDLSEILYLTKNVTGIPIHKMEFYKYVLYPCWGEKNKQPVTAKQLKEFYLRKYHKKIDSSSIRRTLLKELRNNGIVGEERGEYLRIYNYNNKLQKVPESTGPLEGVLPIRKFLKRYVILSSLLTHISNPDSSSFKGKLFGEMKYLGATSQERSKNSKQCDPLPALLHESRASMAPPAPSAKIDLFEAGNVNYSMSDYASFDLEYPKVTHRNIITSFALADSKGYEIAKHVSQFTDFPENPAEKQLVIWLQEEIYCYNTTFAYASTAIKNRRTGKGINSDLKTIYDACQDYGIPSIVAIDGNGDPYIQSRPNEPRKVHIDICKILMNPTIKEVFRGKYANCRLETISTAFLGKGKYNGISGLRAKDLSVDEELKYVLQDAKIPLALVKWDDYKILRLMVEIADITGLGIETTCHNQMLKWWATIIRKEYPTIPQKKTEGKFKYEGGEVLEPPQYHKYYNEVIYVLDIKSLYPTMMKLENLSPEIINCSCCADKPEAKISQRIMDLVNEQHVSEGREPRQHYWKCLNRIGGIPKLIEKLIERKFEHEKNGDKAKEKATKILINGLYGAFANEYFDYSDIRLAELTTAYGRNTLNKLKTFAEANNCNVIYGDTDSIFISGIKDEGQADNLLNEWSKQNPQILVSIKGRYKSYYQSTKKQYWGIPLESKEPIEIIGLDGSDDPELIRKLQQQFLYDIREGKNPIIGLKTAYDNIQTGEVNHELLKIYKNLGVDPEEYKQENKNKIIGISENLKAGETLWYFDVDKRNEEYRSLGSNNYSRKTEYLKDSKNICKANYTDMLRRRFEHQVNALGYDYDSDVVGADPTTTTTITTTIPSGEMLESYSNSNLNQEKSTNKDADNSTSNNNDEKHEE